MRVFVISVFLFLTGLQAIPSVAAATFTVRHAEGENTVLRAGQSVWLPLQADDELQLGDRIFSSEGGVLQIQSSVGILELTDRADLLIRAAGAAEAVGPITLELAAGHLKGDWNSDWQRPLTIQVPGGEFSVENGFFSLWIYSLLGKPYT
ncbi:MAG: hypothetical protein KBC91_06325, partial [Candidatus Omnitrophica bacterium]|nr:hypothetical protein [Candidatus Omnitrophota bacterium]